LRNFIEFMANYDGNVTDLLKAVFGRIQFRILKQWRGEATAFAEKLAISRSETVNYRVVLFTSGKPICLAFSVIPLGRVGGEFKEFLSRTEAPLGELIKKCKSGIRRKMLYSITTDDVYRILNILPDYSSILIDYNPDKLLKGDMYFARNYTMFKDDFPFADVVEVFNVSTFL